MVKDKIKFEDCVSQIDIEISKRKGKWQLCALSYMDFEDVAQLLRLHIFKKWDLWDQEIPMFKWVNRVISNRMINIARDNYGHLAPPCNGCKHNLDAKHCSLTVSGEKCAECPLYKKWQARREVGYNIKLAASMDTEFFSEKSISVSPESHLDYRGASERLNAAMEKELSCSEWKAYKLMFVDNLSDAAAAKKLNLKKGSENRQPGYRTIFILKARFLEIAKRLIEEQDIV